MNMAEAVSFLSSQVPEPAQGLPDEIFYYVSSVTPLVNVDLLVKDENGRTLLAWRDDRHAGKGWHIPGGIIRFHETLEERLRKVAETEIGSDVAFDPVPLSIKQCIHHERLERSHFVSILYKCSLASSFVPENKGLAPASPGYLKWHSKCPDDLLKFHEMYRPYIEEASLES